MKAVWMQDWSGSYKFPEGIRLIWNWKLSRTEYPNWDSMIEGWANDGVRPMIYMNPYIANLDLVDPDLKDGYFDYLNSTGLFI